MSTVESTGGPRKFPTTRSGATDENDDEERSDRRR
jgi:hypothetical protein